MCGEEEVDVTLQKYKKEGPKEETDKGMSSDPADLARQAGLVTAVVRARAACLRWRCGINNR